MQAENADIHNTCLLTATYIHISTRAPDWPEAADLGESLDGSICAKPAGKSKIHGLLWNSGETE